MNMRFLPVLLLACMVLGGSSVLADTLAETRAKAEKGDAQAQSSLGVCYLKGEGVPKDEVEAVKWFNLSAAQGNEDAAKERAIVEKEMTPEQIAEAQKLSREWKPQAAK